MKKVKAYLRGGLGNQCFIYAAARALALRAGAELEFSLDYFPEDNVYRRKFELDVFNISGVIHSPRCWLRRKIAVARYGVASRLIRTARIGNFCCELRPPSFHAFPADWRGVLEIDGYWHSHAYFDDAYPQLVRDFSLRNASWLEDDELCRTVKATDNAVFCHMRSYKEVPGHANCDMALPVSYYEKALTIMVERFGSANMTVFLFSDNLSWAVARLEPIAGRLRMQIIPVMQKNGCDNQLRDFMLMRSCRHGIVANSSFSRFAAIIGDQEWRQSGFCDGIYIRSSTVIPGYCPDNWIVA